MSFKYVAGTLAAIICLSASLITPANARAKIAFVSDQRVGRSEVWVMNDDGSNQRRLTTSGEDAFSFAPSWAPDGKRLVFARMRIGEHGPERADIIVVREDGSGAQNLTRNLVIGRDELELQFAPAWSPDGTELAFASCCWSGSGTRLYAMRADGGAKRVLASGLLWPFETHQVSTELFLSHRQKLSWTPDGRSIAYLPDVDTSEATVTADPIAIRAVNRDGTGDRLISRGLSDFAGPELTGAGDLALGADGCHTVYGFTCGPQNRAGLFPALARVDLSGTNPPNEPYIRVPISGVPFGWQTTAGPGGRVLFAGGYTFTEGFGIGASAPWVPCTDIYAVNTDGSGLARLTRSAPLKAVEDCDVLFDDSQVTNGGPDWVMGTVPRLPAPVIERMTVRPRRVKVLKVDRPCHGFYPLGRLRITLSQFASVRFDIYKAGKRGKRRGRRISKQGYGSTGELPAGRSAITPPLSPRVRNGRYYWIQGIARNSQGGTSAPVRVKVKVKVVPASCYPLKNRERLNRLLMLLQLHINGQDDVQVYAKTIRTWLEANGAEPGAAGRRSG